MTFWTLLNNIGGLVGLWLGASIITCFRFIIVVARVCGRLCHKISKSF